MTETSKFPEISGQLEELKQNIEELVYARVGSPIYSNESEPEVRTIRQSEESIRLETKPQVEKRRILGVILPTREHLVYIMIGMDGSASEIYATNDLKDDIDPMGRGIEINPESVINKDRLITNIVLSYGLFVHSRELMNNGEKPNEITTKVMEAIEFANEQAIHRAENRIQTLPKLIKALGNYNDKNLQEYPTPGVK